jgi:hypothetical protein
MTAPTTPASIVKLGPGTLKIGPSATQIDVSCNVVNAKIAATKSTGTTVRYLCGASNPGVTTYDYALSGQSDVDAGADDGLFAYAWNNPGITADFTFTPNTDAAVSATGQLVLDPLDFGADEYGANLSSAFTYATVGQPTITWPVIP